MIIPRLVIADERREGTVPPGVILAAALKSAGHPLRIFCAGPDEYLVRLTTLVTGEEVTVLDPFSCGTARVLKTLFQFASDRERLNIILAPLGQRGDDGGFSLFPQGPELSRVLECPLIPVMFADSSATIIARVLEKAVSGIAAHGEIPVPAVLFASVLNPREFQLLEIEAGRRAPLLSLGYIPKLLERNRSTLLELCLDAMAERAAFPVKAAASQLASLPGQIDWNAFWGFARLNQEWTEVAEPFRGKAAGLTVGVVTHSGLDLEGDNARRLFSYLGCSVRKIFLEETRPALDVNAVYVPHGLGFLSAEKILAAQGAREWFSGLFKSRKVVFVNGGAAPLLGESFALPNGKQYEGMNIFHYRGKYDMPSEDLKKVEVSSLEGDILLNLGEKLRGYLPSYASVINPGDAAQSLWSVKEPGNGKEKGFSGWNKGYGVVTDLCIELWSNVEGIYRWLVLRKK
ncbi:MAG: hypothetical protein EOM65_09275 [Synergistales bacterium]|nr:hypothetical protein [Synergistales bacterium]